MRIGLGDRVWTRDGHDVGTIDRLIIDPGRGEVRAAILRKGRLLHRDVEVAADAIETGPDGRLHLTYNVERLDELPAFHEDDYTDIPPDPTAVPAGYPSQGLYWPRGYVVSPPTYVSGRPVPAGAAGDTLDAALDQASLDNTLVGEGSTVKSRDGQTVGEVQQLTFDERSGRLREIVVRKGFLFTEDVRLPAERIAGLADGVVYLTLDAADLT